jgi:hypothetical protein
MPDSSPAPAPLNSYSPSGTWDVWGQFINTVAASTTARAAASAQSPSAAPGSAPRVAGPTDSAALTRHRPVAPSPRSSACARANVSAPACAGAQRADPRSAANGATSRDPPPIRLWPVARPSVSSRGRRGIQGKRLRPHLGRLRLRARLAPQPMHQTRIPLSLIPLPDALALALAHTHQLAGLHRVRFLSLTPATPFIRSRSFRLIPNVSM